MGNNILFCFEYMPYNGRGGISNVSIRLSKYFRAHYGLKCYCLYMDIEPECKDTSYFDGCFQIEKNKANINHLTEFITENEIGNIIFQVAWNFNLFKLIKKAAKLTDTPIITAIHGLPRQIIYTVDEYLKNNIPHGFKESVAKKIRPVYLRYLYNKLRYRNLYLCRNSDKMVWLTLANKNDYLSFYAIDNNEKFRVIPNPTTFDYFYPKDKIANKENIVLVVSRFEEKVKRLSLILKIWKIMESSYKTNWKLIIIGSGSEMDMYLNLSKKLELQNVIFEGYKNPFEYYKKASIFLMTSLFEGFPLTLVEAQQCGVVPIAMDSFESLRDIISDGINGIIVPDNNIHEYASKLNGLINDIGYRNSMQLNAIGSSRKYSIETVASEWISLFEK